MYFGPSDHDTPSCSVLLVSHQYVRMCYFKKFARYTYLFQQFLVANLNCLITQARMLVTTFTWMRLSLSATLVTSYHRTQIGFVRLTGRGRCHLLVYVCLQSHLVLKLSGWTAKGTTEFIIQSYHTLFLLAYAAFQAGQLSNR